MSVIICTYNRSALLADTLRTLTRSLLSYQKPVEVLVVDNASTDDTTAVAKSFMAGKTIHSITLLREERKGLSFARNTGLEHAKGEAICFLDDDVFVPEGWLEGLLAAFALREDVGCVAGQVRLHFPDVPRPAWLDGKYNGLYGECHRGDRSRILNPGDDFVGANFALTRKAASAVP